MLDHIGIRMHQNEITALFDQQAASYDTRCDDQAYRANHLHTEGQARTCARGRHL